MGIDIIPQEGISITDGAHTGVLTDIKEEVRGEGKYTYIDVYVSVDGIKKQGGGPITIKDGMPKQITKGSKLGKTLKRFGLSDEMLEKAIRQEIPIDITLFLKKGMKVQYIVMGDEKGDRTYARIVEGSLKPLAVASQQGAAPSMIDQAFVVN